MTRIEPSYTIVHRNTGDADKNLSKSDAITLLNKIGIYGLEDYFENFLVLVHEVSGHYITTRKVSPKFANFKLEDLI